MGGSGDSGGDGGVDASIAAETPRVAPKRWLLQVRAVPAADEAVARGIGVEVARSGRIWGPKIEDPCRVRQLVGVAIAIQIVVQVPMYWARRGHKPLSSSFGRNDGTASVRPEAAKSLDAHEICHGRAPMGGCASLVYRNAIEHAVHWPSPSRSLDLLGSGALALRNHPCGPGPFPGPSQSRSKKR
eukprot:3580733-Prymnesium_polylepis.1